MRRAQLRASLPAAVATLFAACAREKFKRCRRAGGAAGEQQKWQAGAARRQVGQGRRQQARGAGAARA